MIYLDNAATTRPFDVVIDEMNYVNDTMFYNSAALYKGAIEVKKAVDRATDEVHNALTKTKKGTVVFTSGATESNNMVIFGKITRKDAHVLFLAGEHSSVYAPAVHLKNNGFDVGFIPLLPNGAVNVNEMKKMIKSNTALIVFGLVNSDTGYLQDAKSIVHAIRSVETKRPIHIHMDATQGFCKFDFDVQDFGVDSAAVSAHKIHGPKGIGALWLAGGAKIQPIMFGGAQQDYRPGTEYTAGIIGFAMAVRECRKLDGEQIKWLHSLLVKGLPKSCKVNGDNNNPYITNIMLPNVYGQTVMNYLSEKGIYAGLGSACSSTASKNRTLLAMGIPEKQTKNVLRISLSYDTTENDIREFLRELKSFLGE